MKLLLYNQSLYNDSAFNQEIQNVYIEINITCQINSCTRVRNISKNIGIETSVLAETTALCLANSNLSINVNVNTDYQRIRNIALACGVVINTNVSSSALRNIGLHANVSLDNIAIANANYSGLSNINVSSAISTSILGTCTTSTTINVAVNTDVTRTRMIATRFGQALKINASNNEGLKIQNTGNIIFNNRGSVECLIYTYNATSTNDRYIFDGGGVLNKNLTIIVTTDNKLKVSFGNGITTYNIISSKTLLRDGASWIYVGWDENGVEVYIDMQKVGESSVKPNIEFGPYIYVGCSASQTNSLDGYLDEFRINSRKRTEEELLQIQSSTSPLEWDMDTTYLLHFDGNLNLPAVKRGIWQSPVLDVSLAKDLASSRAYINSVLSGGGSVVIQSRSASQPNGVWSEWYDSAFDLSLLHPANYYIQVRLIYTLLNDSASVSTDSLKINYDTNSEVEVLTSDMASSELFNFATLLDKVIIINGINAPRVYDGENISLLNGNPPYAKYIVTHKNRIFMANTNSNPSRLYFSDILNIESWPVLNFIDINPNDGDEITGLLPYGDYLIITKKQSIWLLTGEGINTFAVKRIHADKGCYAPRSLTIVDGYLCFVSDDGIYFSDLSKCVLISERIKNYWNKLNKRRLNQAASYYLDHKLYVAVPEGNSMYNNAVIVYDTLRKSFACIRKNINLSCFASYREAGSITYLAGSSIKGQVYKLNEGYSDDNNPITFVYKSKDFDFRMPDVYKRWNEILLQVRPSQTSAELIFTFYVDGREVGSTTVSVPGVSTEDIYTIQVLASKAGVIGGRRLAMKITQNVLNNPVGIHRISIKYISQSTKPTIYA